MRGLSKDIELSLDTLIEGLSYNFFSDVSGDVVEGDILDAEKMRKIMESKVSSFNSAKRILYKWMSSPNAPDDKKIHRYIKRMLKAGESAIKILRKGLSITIDYDTLDPHKHDAAVKAKPIILDAIFSLDSSIEELRTKLDSGNLELDDKEFNVGYPERFAKGEFYSKDKYYKKWYDKYTDSVNICPFSTKGEIVTIGDLNIQLPKPPKDKSKILFYNLPKSKQYWQRLTVPNKLTPDNIDDWKEYVLEEFRRRREGIWFMNNGKPVYLTGNHYFALQWCKMLDGGKYMEFRYAQLNMFYHIQACMVDSRCLGQLFVKSRRTGYTYSVLFVMLNESTSIRNKNFGMTSKSNEDARKAFAKYKYALINLPFFFRPMIKGKLDSPREFEFGAPLSSSKDAKKNKYLGHDDYLNTFIDYQPTKDDSYDGQAMYLYLGDEAGKWMKPDDYIKHLGQITPTMLEGGVVVGKAFIGSTVGAMAKGGKQFMELHSLSDVKSRNKVTNMTSSGLYRYFLPAQDNMTKFTDKYGECHKVKPKTRIRSVEGELIETGSIEYLISQEEDKKDKSDIALNEQYRAFPRTVEHAFRDESSQSVFNLNKLYEQRDYNNTKEEEKKYVIGNFEWVNGVVDSNVEFYPNVNGRFKIAWLPSKVTDTAHLKNNVSRNNGKIFPLNKEMVRFGCDPYSYKSTHGKGSKGSIHGKTVNLPTDVGVPKNKFVLEYIARPSDENIFYEDVIKCCFYYGSPILVESNRKDLLRHMYNRGYRGFCMNRLDRPKNKLNADELKYGGQMMSGQDILDSHIGAIGTWIENYVGVYNDKEQNLRPIGEMGDMPFNETIMDWIKFDPDKRTEFDATISSGLAIMACQIYKYKGESKPVQQLDISKLFIKYNNKGNVGTLIRRQNA